MQSPTRPSRDGPPAATQKAIGVGPVPAVPSGLSCQAGICIASQKHTTLNGCRLVEAMSESSALEHTVGFELLGPELGKDVRSALQQALAGGAIFASADDPLAIFRQALADSIRSIDSHPRGELFQAFLSKGPYEDCGPIPRDLVDKRLSDADTSSAITFIHSHMVNCFKGAVTELLAARPCLQLLEELQQDGTLPQDARLYVGDAVGVHRARGGGLLKGADMHILVERAGPNGVDSVALAGLAEVKSYVLSQRRIRGQIDQQLRRARRGIRVSGIDYDRNSVRVDVGDDRWLARVGVVPGGWKLPRSFRYADSGEHSVLRVAPARPPEQADRVEQVGDAEWRITLRWSAEALAEAAHGMTFWYMGRVGEIIYAESVPSDWAEMTPHAAGLNAVKMMLYYAVLRCRSAREMQRAVALYNSYGFGYALGMNYKDEAGRREMLWHEDLEEILSSGQSRTGCRIR